MLTLQDIRAAAARIAGAVARTPFLHSQTLSRLTGAEVWLKFENLQFTASFKERGALNKLLTLSEAQRRRGVIAMSAGNHAQGVAHHAARLGMRAVIVMPKGTPNSKLRGTQVHGTARGLWPYEAPALEALGEQAQPIAAPPQDLVPIAAAAPKHKQLARERILGQLRLDQSRQAIKAITQIGRPAGEPDPRATRQRNHRTAASTSRSIARSTIPRTRRQPLARSISITPAAGDVIGSCVITATAANPPLRTRRCRRQYDSRFGRTPCHCTTFPGLPHGQPRLRHRLVSSPLGKRPR